MLPDTDLPTESEHRFATWSQPFRLSTGRGADLTAAVSDTQLSSYFDAGHRDPVLAANQLLADLAMIHSELPRASATRGVIAVPPYGLGSQPALRGGTAGRPGRQPGRHHGHPARSSSRMVPVGGNDAPTTRHLNADENGSASRRRAGRRRS